MSHCRPNLRWQVVTLCFITKAEAHDSRAVLVRLKVSAVAAAMNYHTLGGSNNINLLSPSMATGRLGGGVSFLQDILETVLL